jgi:hypothetical protein
MRFDELFKNLGYLAGTIGSQVRDTVTQGVPLEELDLTGPAPRKVALLGPAQLVLNEGEVFRVDVETTPGPENPGVRFTLEDGKLGVAGGDSDTVVHITLPAATKLTVAGSGRMTAEKLARDGKVSIAGSGRLEIAAVEGGKLKVSIAGSGRLAADGQADELELSIAGSGSCDAEGLVTEKASVHIAGSGDAIFTCNGEVSAHLMGSGNVIVRGSARCSVQSMGSGTVTCERASEAAN